MAQNSNFSVGVLSKLYVACKIFDVFGSELLFRSSVAHEKHGPVGALAKHFLYFVVFTKVFKLLLLFGTFLHFLCLFIKNLL